jgi:hypothetical protein
MDHRRELKEAKSKDVWSCWANIGFYMQTKLWDVDKEPSITKLGIQGSHCISYNKIKWICSRIGCG